MGVPVYGPSKEEVDDGASWVRCDAVFPETWEEEWKGARSVTVAAPGLANDPPEELGLPRPAAHQVGAAVHPV